MAQFDVAEGSEIEDLSGHEYFEILGAREHNVKDVNLIFPRNLLVVITGISGSG